MLLDILIEILEDNLAVAQSLISDKEFTAFTLAKLKCETVCKYFPKLITILKALKYE